MRMIVSGTPTKMSSVKKRTVRALSPDSPFAANLRRTLEERRINASHLAKVIDVPPATLHGWCNGAGATDMAAVLRLATTLGIDFQLLLTGVPRAPSSNFEDHFEIKSDPALTGVFAIEFKRLVPKKKS